LLENQTNTIPQHPPCLQGNVMWLRNSAMALTSLISLIPITIPTVTLTAVFTETVMWHVTVSTMTITLLIVGVL